MRAGEMNADNPAPSSEVRQRKTGRGKETGVLGAGAGGGL